MAWQEPGSTDHAQLQKIRSLLFADLMRVPPGKQVSKHCFAWNVDGSLASLGAYDGVELLFTLTFTWNVDGTLKDVSRS